MKNDTATFIEAIVILGICFLIAFLAFGLFRYIVEPPTEKPTALESVVISTIKIDEETGRLLSNVDILIDELFVEREKNKILEKELDICKKTCVVKENK